MGLQRPFAGLAWSDKKKVTRRERFLTEMDAEISWARLVAVIAPHYRKPGRGRPPLGLEKTLRIYFLQQWFDLSDPQTARIGARRIARRAPRLGSPIA
jgi:transposase, IS5 family